MANSKQVKSYSNYITVDTNPGEGGYWTDPIGVRSMPDRIPVLYFSVREDNNETPSVVTPVLQFKCEGDSNWTDYHNGENFSIGDRVRIEDNGPRVQWRAGVKQDGFTSGRIRIGFDW